ncbi:MAG: ATP-utilizing phosphoenolpyruvate carboxykinase [Olpidium bornovanus]|uniref:ATP-utilizing phosphoenolpyruvate carboxykinase n=1 Tax=Olpidium bornovanus TaxID=278681 RepID=A0A8H8DHA3_9FUNG|nr:MAG: ATP-utilizing phosphoenolpyruvate carboxykinase [Olpidium bornovanus]
MWHGESRDTGKTTLSAGPRRELIGDDGHCWSEKGVFNIEGGIYAKCIVDLSEEKKPGIFNSIWFSAVTQNVVFDHDARGASYSNSSITENTRKVPALQIYRPRATHRCAYANEHIPNAKVPCLSGHPKNIILLPCDAFGVLPPVPKLTSALAMYHFLSGCTAKICRH